GPDTEVRVTSVVSNAYGTLGFTWNVMKGGTLVPFEDAQSNHSEISFFATESGNYAVTLDVQPSSGRFCPQGTASVNVVQDMNAMRARLHITPPASAGAPLVDRPIQIHEATGF